MKTIILDKDNPQGRAEYLSEPKVRRGDCVARAYAIAKGIAYSEAKAAWEAVGWGTKRLWFWGAAGKMFGGRRMARSGTLGRFCTKNPTGRFFVVVDGGAHAIAVVDGVVYDHSPHGPLERIKAAWRIV